MVWGATNDEDLMRPKRRSPASIKMLERIADAERQGKMLPFRRVDYRVHSKLSADGLVAVNLFHNAVCLTPAGRAALAQSRCQV